MARLLLTVLSICVFASCTTAMQDLYPVGEINGVSTVKYARNQPMYIHMPDHIPPNGVPIVIFNHERTFTNPTKGKYSPDQYTQLTDLLIENGIAVALPVRSGYYSTPGPDCERIPCDSPSPTDFRHAGKAATRSICAAVQFVKKLPDIDSSRIFVGGTSAGGFSTIFAIPKISDDVRGVFSLNGGRCGKRGEAFNGLSYVQEIYEKIARNSRIPVVFFAGGFDSVIPPYSTQKLYESFCAGRGIRCKTSVYLVKAALGSHTVSSMVPLVGNQLVHFINSDIP